MLVIGLTGGIGCGKSTVAQYFKDFGVTIIDADEIARQVVAPGAAVLKDIRQHFGSDVFDGEQLNRAALRDIVFNDPEQRKYLEKLLHPLIRLEIARRVAVLHEPYCIVEIPLLLESTPNPLIQRILVVDCDEQLQIQRTMRRNQLNEQQVKNTMAAQVSREYRLKAADDIIDNNKDHQHLQQQVQQLHQHYLQLAKKK